MNDRSTPFAAFRRCVLIPAIFLLFLAPSRAALALETPTWRDTGLVVADRAMCFDATRAHTVFLNDGGALAYDWVTGQRTELNQRGFVTCGPNGLLYDLDGDTGVTWRFSMDDPAGRQIAHSPTHVAQDGTSQVYALNGSSREARGRLWYSPDGGLTWRERGQQFRGAIEHVAVAEADARALYALVVNRGAGQSVDYTIFFSSDSGATWQRRSGGQSFGDGPGFPAFTLDMVPGGTSPVDIIRLSIDTGSGSSQPTRSYLSVDGARTFGEPNPAGLDVSTQLVHTNEGILRMSSTGSQYSLSLLPDGEQIWHPRPNPPDPTPPAGRPTMEIARNAPANVFVRDGNGLWYSPDSGMSWQQYEDKATSFISPTPSLPLSVLAISGDNRLHALDLFDGGGRVAIGVAPNGAPGGSYFPETNHNLFGSFKRYWESHGGLAQFGYPRTEPFREVNPADGRAYAVQYFERNRFEYHPEFAGTPNEVLLGLLGNQFTEARRVNGDPPFLPVADPHNAGQRFFPATGHTLRGALARYWERNGGLAIYGYPLSEEFEEMNSEDGKTYVVQYFERARFEYHPENQGTRYEVLLGLLGNKLLKEKGWL